MFLNPCSVSPAGCTAAGCVASESGHPGCRWADSCLRSICCPALLPPGCCSRCWSWKSSSSRVTQQAGQHVNKSSEASQAAEECKCHCSPFGQVLDSPVLLSLLPAGRRSPPAAKLVWHVAAVVLSAALQSSMNAATWLERGRMVDGLVFNLNETGITLQVFWWSAGSQIQFSTVKQGHKMAAYCVELSMGWVVN